MNGHEKFVQNSVAIGGLGGSGTRLIAEIIQLLGFYMGDTQNEAHDNLWFTLLFKRYDWFNKFPNDEAIRKTILLFERSMTSGLLSDIQESELHLIWKIAEKNNQLKPTKDAGTEVAQQLVASNPPYIGRYIGWGWKEPNTHIFLPMLTECLKGLKYIHVIRNGLDMSLSTNQRQLLNWGKFFNSPHNRDLKPSPTESLDFWITANRRAIAIGKQKLGNRFYLLNYDWFCSNPSNGLLTIIDFLGVTTTPKLIEIMVKLIKPISIGRFKHSSLGSFTRTQIEAVRKLGFEINE